MIRTLTALGLAASLAFGPAALAQTNTSGMSTGAMSTGAMSDDHMAAKPMKAKHKMKAKATAKDKMAAPMADSKTGAMSTDAMSH